MGSGDNAFSNETKILKQTGKHKQLHVSFYNYLILYKNDKIYDKYLLSIVTANRRRFTRRPAL